MYAAIVIVLMSGGPECDSWLERFFSIECATVARELRRETIRRNGDRDRSGEGPDGDGDGGKGGDPSTGGGGQPPGGGSGTPPSPPDTGGGTPPTPTPTGDANKGHGNDPGRHDPDNPGKGQGKGRNR
jgi:hypothetical protein